MGIGRIEKKTLDEDTYFELYQIVSTPHTEEEGKPGVVIHVLGMALSFETETNSTARRLFSSLVMYTRRIEEL